MPLAQSLRFCASQIHVRANGILPGADLSTLHFSAIARARLRCSI